MSVPNPIRCAFLTSDTLEAYIIDDALTVVPLAARGVQVSMVVWHDNVNWSDYDVVVVRSTWDYHKRTDQFFDMLDRVEQSTAILANPLHALRWNACKTYLKQLERQGVATIETRWGEALNDNHLVALHQSFAGERWVLKPIVGASASHTFAIDEITIATRHDAMLSSYADRAWLAQPFVHSIHDEGEYSMFYFDGTFSHSVNKRPAPGDFRVQKEFGGLTKPFVATDEMLAVAVKVMAHIPVGCLYVRIDLARDNIGTLCVMEVELIEPALFFGMSEEAPEKFADALVRWFNTTKIRA